MIRPLAKRDVFYAGSTSSLHKRRASAVSASKASLTMLAEHRHSVVSIPAKDVIEKIQPEVRQRQPSGILPPGKKSWFRTSWFQSDILKEMVDVSLIYSSPSFALLALSNFFGFMGFYIPFVYIVQHLRSQIRGTTHFSGAYDHFHHALPLRGRCRWRRLCVGGKGRPCAFVHRHHQHARQVYCPHACRASA